MNRLKTLSGVFVAAMLLAGCQATAPKANEGAAHAAPVGEARDFSEAEALKKLLTGGARYVLYSADPPITFELPPGPIQLEGTSRAVLAQYVAENACVPLSNTTSVGNPLLTVCIERGGAVLRTFESMSYAALSKAVPVGQTIPAPPMSLLELPTAAPGEADEGDGDGEGEEQGTAAFSTPTIVAIPMSGSPYEGYPVAQYLVVPSPETWTATPARAELTDNAGCRQLMPLGAPAEPVAMCYLDNELTILPSEELLKLLDSQSAA